jgi:hypothetical protein
MKHPVKWDILYLFVIPQECTQNLHSPETPLYKVNARTAESNHSSNIRYKHFSPLSTTEILDLYSEYITLLYTHSGPLCVGYKLECDTQANEAAIVMAE